MKKTIQSIIIAAFAISLTATSCSKDESTKTATPTVTLSDSTGSGKIDTANFYFTTIMKLNVTPAAGTTIESLKTDISVNSIAVITGTFQNVDEDQKAGFSEPALVDLFVTSFNVEYGSKITFTVTAKDSKGQTSSASFTYNVAKDNAIMASPEIELGAQTNTTIPYKFLGLANNFMTYTAGADGTAKLNSGDIDFVYYYGATDKNAFAAPSNADGAKIIWNSEINMWTKQNRTKFKATTLTAADFDNIKNTTKVDDTFAGIDFTTGTVVDKVTQLTVGSVYAFQTVGGVHGLAKFTSIAADATGSTKVILVCQN